MFHRYSDPTTAQCVSASPVRSIAPESPIAGRAPSWHRAKEQKGSPRFRMQAKGFGRCSVSPENREGLVVTPEPTNRADRDRKSAVRYRQKTVKAWLSRPNPRIAPTDIDGLPPAATTIPPVHGNEAECSEVCRHAVLPEECVD